MGPFHPVEKWVPMLPLPSLGLGGQAHEALWPKPLSFNPVPWGVLEFWVMKSIPQLELGPVLCVSPTWKEEGG